MKGYSLNIGLNYVDPNHYGGWNGKLNACEYDAYDMQNIATSLGYKTKILIREKATRKNVINSITDLSKQVNSGDILYISYSGHGSQLPDLNSDEDDALDETWCLFDGQLIDDELKKLWSLFKNDVRIFVTSDSCHSGSIIKLYDESSSFNQNEGLNIKVTPHEIASRTYYNNKDFYDTILKGIQPENQINIKASVKLISGCKDDQFSYDGPYNGVFTAHLKKVWNGGKFKGDYALFQKRIKQSINSKNQIPQLLNIGESNSVFDIQIPYQI